MIGIGVDGMVDIPLQFCIRGNVKNNAVKSYK